MNPKPTVQNEVTLITISGEDKPGISASLLGALAEHDATVLDIGQAVIYKGPYSQVEDDEGHVFPRGERIAVCERTFRFLTEGPHQSDFIGINPKTPQPAVNFCAPAGTIRSVQETRGGIQIVNGCEEGSNCC